MDHRQIDIHTYIQICACIVCMLRSVSVYLCCVCDQFNKFLLSLELIEHGLWAFTFDLNAQCVCTSVLLFYFKRWPMLNLIGDTNKNTITLQYMYESNVCTNQSNVNPNSDLDYFLLFFFLKKIVSSFL